MESDHHSTTAVREKMVRHIRDASRDLTGGAVVALLPWDGVAGDSDRVGISGVSGVSAAHHRRIRSERSVGGIWETGSAFTQTEKAAGRQFRDQVYAWWQRQWDETQPDYEVPWVLSQYRHECPVQQGARCRWIGGRCMCCHPQYPGLTRQVGVCCAEGTVREMPSGWRCRRRDGLLRWINVRQQGGCAE